jgi:hypothetical protein
MALAAGLTALALAVPATALAAPAQRAGADCHAYNVLISTPVIHGHPKIRASATVVCTTAPDSIHVRLSILQHVRVSGHLRWVSIAYGPADHRIPSPTRRYRLPIGCRRGTFRTEVTIGGRRSDHRTAPNRHFYSVPTEVNGCVSGNRATVGGHMTGAVASVAAAPAQREST